MQWNFSAPSELPAKLVSKIERQGKSWIKDRIAGSAKQAKGAVKEAVGKVTGDAKLQSEGKSDKVAGKVQNTVGGIKDAIRGKPSAANEIVQNR